MLPILISSCDNYLDIAEVSALSFKKFAWVPFPDPGLPKITTLNMRTKIFKMFGILYCD